LNEIENAPVKSLDSISTIIKGRYIPSSKYSLVSKKNTLPYIRIKDMEDGKINQKKTVFVDVDKDTLMKGSMIEEGDLLLSVDGTIGKVAVAPNIRALVSSGIVVLKTKPEIVDNQYLFIALSSDKVKGQMANLTTGLLIRHLTKRAVKQLMIPIPSLEKQKEIAAKHAK